MTDPYDSIPEHWVCSEEAANSIHKILLYENWLLRWQHRIGARALKRCLVAYSKPCSTCGQPARTFSIGEWFCDQHLPSGIMS